MLGRSPRPGRCVSLSCMRAHAHHHPSAMCAWYIASHASCCVWVYNGTLAGECHACIAPTPRMRCTLHRPLSCVPDPTSAMQRILCQHRMHCMRHPSFAGIECCLQYHMCIACCPNIVCFTCCALHKWHALHYTWYGVGVSMWSRVEAAYVVAWRLHVKAATVAVFVKVEIGIRIV